MLLKVAEHAAVAVSLGILDELNLFVFRNRQGFWELLQAASNKLAIAYRIAIANAVASIFASKVDPFNATRMFGHFESGLRKEVSLPIVLLLFVRLEQIS